MLSFLKREKSKKLENQLNTLQKEGPAAWADLPEDELFTPAGFHAEQAEATASSNYSYWGSTFRAFFKNKAAVALLIALVAVVAFAFLQPYLPGQADPNLCAVDPVTGIQYRNIAPGQDGFIWGSNSIGQDLWARIWAGARTSLTIAFFVALIEAVVGITAGVLWGYVRGLDFLFTELYNIFDNIPTAIVLILISYVASPSIWTMILGMSIKGWIEMARFIRNQILIIRDRDYNVASRCIGTPTVRIVLRNLLPYLVSVIMLRMALTIPEAIGNEVFITYIGLGLSVETPSLGNLVNDGRKAFAAVQNANFQIYKGETFGLVGESGSGKTTIGRAILRILPTSGGEILYKGQKINGKIPRALDKQITREIQMIFQDPQSSLNERAKVSYIVGEGLQNVRPDLSAAQREEKVRQALLDVGLLPEFASRFPHEFSGGQRQRIGIARALIVEPEFIVADEPISALDMSIRAQVLNLLRRLQKERGITYLFIAHDLSVMRYISDRIAVIHKGSIVELADAEELVAHAIHPYTRSLLSAIPMPDPRRERNKKLLVYDPAMHDYSTEAPQWRELRPRHWVLCSAAEAAQWLPQA